VSQVTWTLPLIPPKYPAQQYAVLEADGRNIELPSFNIAVMPVLPTTSEADLTTAGLQKLYDGFDQIQNGVGAPNQDATLAFGLAKVKGGVQQLSDGLASLEDNVKKIRVGVSNPNFDVSSYSTATGQMPMEQLLVPGCHRADEEHG
jgi:X-X-X-Leu-X-X-Gly heptad repeat protein